MDLSNFKSTEFVSQYAGLPIDEFLQSATALQQRAQQNTQQLDQLEMMANNIKTLDIDDNLKREQLAKIDKQMQDLAASGAYEHATDRIRMEAKGFARNEDLMSASASYAKLQKMKEEAKAIGATDIQLQKIDNALQLYEAQGGAADKASLQDIGFYKEQNLSSAVDKLLSGWKASKTVVATPDGQGYINTVTNEKVTEQELRDQAYKHLASDPQYMRQIEDTARLNLYNNTLQQTGDAQQAYSVYNNADAAMLTGEQQRVIDQIVEPSIAKYSYNNYGSVLDRDPLYNAGGGASTKLGDVPAWGDVDFASYGIIPDSSVKFQAKEQELLATKKSLEQQLTKYQPGTRDYIQIQEQLNNTLGSINMLGGVRKQYISGIQAPDMKVAAIFNEYLKTTPGGLAATKFELAPNTFGQTQATIEKNFADAKTRQDAVNMLAADPEFVKFAEQYGMDPSQVQSVLAEKDTRWLVNKGKDNRTFDMGNDFDSYLDNTGHTVMHQAYTIDDKDKREAATRQMNMTDHTYYDQDTKGPVTDPEKYDKIPKEVVGFTSTGPEGPMLVVQFTMDEDKAGDYAGQTVLVKPSGNISAVLGENLSQVAHTGTTLTTAAGEERAGAIGTANDIGRTSRVEKQIMNVGASGGVRETTIYHNNGNQLADVSVSDLGTYSVVLYGQNGEVKSYSDLTQSQATKLVDVAEKSNY